MHNKQLIVNVLEKDAQPIDQYGFIIQGNYENSISNEEVQEVIQLRKNEKKWLNLLENWHKLMVKKHYLIRMQCRRGIPLSLRARVWQLLSGNLQTIFTSREQYQRLLSKTIENQLASEIKRDLHRQFPTHIIFSSGGNGQNALFNVLKAYCVLHPDILYCQAMAPIAAALLIHIPEEHAFWVFNSICENFMPDYFSPKLVRLKIEMNMLSALVKRYLPKVHSLLAKYHIETIYFAVDWFMCLFTRTLPWVTLLRVLDMFFFEGMKVIFWTALAILELLLGTAESRKRFESMETLLIRLKRLPPEVTSEKRLIPAVYRFTHIGRKELSREYVKQQRLTSAH